MWHQGISQTEAKYPATVRPTGSQAPLSFRRLSTFVELADHQRFPLPHGTSPHRNHPSGLRSPVVGLCSATRDATKDELRGDQETTRRQQAWWVCASPSKSALAGTCPTPRGEGAKS